MSDGPALIQFLLWDDGIIGILLLHKTDGSSAVTQLPERTSSQPLTPCLRETNLSPLHVHSAAAGQHTGHGTRGMLHFYGPQPKPSRSLPVRKSDLPAKNVSQLAEQSHSTGMTARDQQFLRTLLIVFLVVFTAEWLYVTSRQPEPLELKRGEYFQSYFRVDINNATWIDWMQLEGIGPSLAHRIEADRRVNGPFLSIDDLQRVSGIGKVTLDRIRARLYLDIGPDPVQMSAQETFKSASRAPAEP